jgi:hypothetical protein
LGTCAFPSILCPPLAARLNGNAVKKNYKKPQKTLDNQQSEGSIIIIWNDSGLGKKKKTSII